VTVVSGPGLQAASISAGRALISWKTASAEASFSGAVMAAKPNTFIPAALAAATPSGLSSTTTQSAGFTPIVLAACRKRSGAGLPCRTSSELKIRPSKRSQNPTAVSAVWIRRWVPEEARQYGVPAASR